MEQINHLTTELDNIHNAHQGTLNQMDFLKQKTDEETDLIKRKLMQLEDLRNTILICISAINSFSKQFENSSGLNMTPLQLCVSRKFRDFMQTFTNTIPQTTEIIDLDMSLRKVADFIKINCEEIESIARIIGSFKSESQVMEQKINSLESKLNAQLLDTEGLQERERYLKAEAENLREEKRRLELERELAYKREKQLEAENYSLRTENDHIKRDAEKLETQARQATLTQEKIALEIKHKTLTAERDNLTVRNLDEKLDFLASEKRDLELMLAKIASSLPNLDMQKTISGLVKTITDLHTAVREKHRLTAALMQAEGMLRTHISATATISDPSMGVRLRKDVERLRDELSACEERIELDKKQLNGLEDELKGLEVGERRKASVYIDNEKLLAEKRKQIEDLERKTVSARYEEPLLMEREKAKSFVGDSERYEKEEVEKNKFENPTNISPSPIRTYGGQGEIMNRSTLQQRLMNVKSSFSTIGGYNKAHI